MGKGRIALWRINSLTEREKFQLGLQNLRIPFGSVPYKQHHNCQNAKKLLRLRGRHESAKKYLQASERGYWRWGVIFAVEVEGGTCSTTSNIG